MGYLALGEGNYESPHVVESAGAVLVRRKTREVCLLYRPASNTYVSAKGRRDCGESHYAAAARETAEETGVPCRLLPLTMETRAPGPGLESTANDEPRLYEGITEPINIQVWETSKLNIKIIWWFVAEVDEEAYAAQGGEPVKTSHEAEFYTTVFIPFDKVYDLLLEKSHVSDYLKATAEVTKRAISLVDQTYGIANKAES